MSTQEITQATESPPATIELDPFARAVQTVAGAAAAISLPLLWLSISSLASAVLVWGAWVAPFLTASIVSLIAGLGSLGLLAVPGLLLLKAHWMLRDLARLPGRVDALKGLAPLDVLAQARADAEKAAPKGRGARMAAMARAYGRIIIDLRTAVLGAEEALVKMVPQVCLIASPVTFLLAGFAIVVSSLLSVLGLAAFLRLVLA
jgi:hypothetical protein